jgi:hypothetical protein
MLSVNICLGGSGGWGGGGGVGWGGGCSYLYFVSSDESQELRAMRQRVLGILQGGCWVAVGGLSRRGVCKRWRRGVV